MPIRVFTNFKECVKFLYNKLGPNAVAKLPAGGDVGKVNEKLLEKIEEYLHSDKFKEFCNSNKGEYGEVKYTSSILTVNDDSGEVSVEVRLDFEDGQDGAFEFYIRPPNTAGGAHIFYSMWVDAEGWHTPSLDDRDHGKDTKCGSLICGRCGGVCL